MRKRSGVYRTEQRGFTLIEVLVAVAVLSFGLLAIGSFHAKLINQSTHNKARTEALALAQEKLDELRNYANAHELVGKLVNNPVANPAPGSEYLYVDDVPTAEKPYADATTIDGTNATFTRSWTISRLNELSKAVVTVKWSDRDGAQYVTLETDLTYRNPRGTADVGQISQPLVESPTGKAYLGDGSLSNTEMTEVKNKDGTTNNNDGTYTGDYDGDGDLELIVEQSDGSGEVVLTLPDACKLEEGCHLGFVKINGSVFIDRTGGSNLAATDVFVLASDAAYCARWVPTGVSGSTLAVSTNLTAPAKSGGDIYRNNDATVDWTGAGQNNYDYFNYTCYLGGGWYGNIGLVLTKANSQDYACVGDPEPSVPAVASEAWKKVELAKRRVYRGMVHKYTVDPVTLDHVEVTNAGGDTIFWTRGISDGAQLPDPTWAERNYGHDFVISRGNNPTRADCVDALSRPDANPDGTYNNSSLFHNVAGDFICLNRDNNDSWTTGTWEKFLYAPFEYLNYKYTDEKEYKTFDARADCPYDPSDPPAHRYTIVGTLTLEDPSSVVWGSADPADISDEFIGNINTSDGLANCTVTNDQVSTSITYSCDYYVWEDQNGQIRPWSGNVQVDTPNDLVCAPDNPYDAANLDRHTAYELTDILGPTPVTANFTCKNLNKFQIRGTVSVDAGNDLSAETLLIAAENMGAEGCIWNSIGAESATYTCTVLEQDYISGYTGEISITLPADYICTASSVEGTATISPLPSGSLASFAFNALPYDGLPVDGNNVVCDGPMELYTISGTVANGVKPALAEFLNTTVTIADGSCTQQPATNGKDILYSCDVVTDTRISETWSGDVVIAPPTGYWCGTTTANATLSVTTSSDLDPATTVTCTTDPNDAVTISGSVTLWYPSDTAWYFDAGGYGAANDWAGTCSLALGCDPLTMATGTVTPLTIEMIGSDGVTVEGTCSFTSPTLADPEPSYYAFSCTTNGGVLTYPSWSGSIRYSSGDPAPLWAQYCADMYPTSVTVAAGDTVSVGTNAYFDAPPYCP